MQYGFSCLVSSRGLILKEILERKVFKSYLTKYSVSCFYVNDFNLKGNFLLVVTAFGPGSWSVYVLSFLWSKSLMLPEVCTWRDLNPNLLGRAPFRSCQTSKIWLIKSLSMNNSSKMQIDWVSQVCVGFVKMTLLKYLPRTFHQSAVDQ